MAKAKSSGGPKLDGLDKGLEKAHEALPDLLLLVGPKGLFAEKDKELAEKAVQQGLLVEHVKTVVSGSGKKKALKEVVYGELTEAGLRKVVDRDSPKESIEALRLTLEKMDRPTVPLEVEAFRAELEKVCRAELETVNASLAKTMKDAEGLVEAMNDAAALVKAMNDAAVLVKTMNAEAASLFKTINKGATSLAKSMANEAAALAKASNGAFESLQSTLSNFSGPTGPPRADVAPVLSAISSTLDRVKPLKTTVSPSSPDLDSDVVSFVKDWARDGRVGAPFDALWGHLRTRRPGLSVGAFQDALRRLAESKQIGLASWSKRQDELPEPELAFFVSGAVMYYAKLPS